jgi:3-hydroxymyristoyl/3-hydroxydecanoyl-(acyl carrier protein) dehydratase
LNYMKMVRFIEVSGDYVLSETQFSEREEFFRHNYPRKKIVPPFVIIESIFQTAGRMVRAYTNDKFGGIIASFSNFNFIRPIFANETVRISSRFKSGHEKSCMVLINLVVEDQVILENGKLMLILEPGIVSDHLNNSLASDLEGQKNYFLGALK